jgi:uncharacterized protein with GYD domain
MSEPHKRNLLSTDKLGHVRMQTLRAFSTEMNNILGTVS